MTAIKKIKGGFGIKSDDWDGTPKHVEQLIRNRTLARTRSKSSGY